MLNLARNYFKIYRYFSINVHNIPKSSISFENLLQALPNFTRGMPGIKIVTPERLRLVLNELGQDIKDNERNMDSSLLSKEFINSDVCQYLLAQYGEKIDDKEIHDPHDVFKRPIPEDQSMFPVRPPVVTVMGHVDHGKTTLLDYFRKTSVAKNEFGGITQHVGAFSVGIGDETVTFLDTPGHAAFCEMRHRGAQATDIVVLVIAVNDGIQEQTIESIRHIKESNVPCIVAFTKCDYSSSNLETIKDELMGHEIFVEDRGGDVQCVLVSAKTGKNMNVLAEAILTLAEVLDLRADRTGPVEGVIIESKKVPDRGIVATILVQRGTLNINNFLVCGTVFCRVKSMRTNIGTINSATPASAVEVGGWVEAPHVGGLVLGVEDRAISVVDVRKTIESKKLAELSHQQLIAQRIMMKNDENLMAQKADLKKMTKKEYYKFAADLEKKEEASRPPQLGLVVFADVLGSLEAIEGIINGTLKDKIEVKILSKHIGSPSPSMIDFAKATNSHILCFNVPVPKEIQATCTKMHVKIESFNVIYDLINYVNISVQDLVKKDYSYKELGLALVKQIFNIHVKGSKTPLMVAGSVVEKGIIRYTKPNEPFCVRLWRNGEMVLESHLSSLKHLKNDVAFVNEGEECGIAIHGIEKLHENDKVQFCSKEPMKYNIFKY